MVKLLVTVFPKPADLWSKDHQHTLLSLFFVFSVAWALEQCVVLFFWFSSSTLRSWAVFGEEYPTLKVCALVICPRVSDRLNGTSTELAFWFFLIDQGPDKRDWFTSWEYRIWSLGPSLLFSALLGRDRMLVSSSLRRYHSWYATHHSACPERYRHSEYVFLIFLSLV